LLKKNSREFDGLVGGVWYLAPQTTIFQVYRGGQFYWWEISPLRRLELIHLTSLSRSSYFQTSRKKDLEYNQFYLCSVIKTQTT
jgi:hypothetical protein